MIFFAYNQIGDKFPITMKKYLTSGYDEEFFFHSIQLFFFLFLTTFLPLKRSIALAYQARKVSSYVLGVSILPLSTIFLLHFRTVQTVWYSLFVTVLQVQTFVSTMKQL